MLDVLEFGFNSDEKAFPTDSCSSTSSLENGEKQPSLTSLDRVRATIIFFSPNSQYIEYTDSLI